MAGVDWRQLNRFWPILADTFTYLTLSERITALSVFGWSEALSGAWSVEDLCRLDAHHKMEQSSIYWKLSSRSRHWLDCSDFRISMKLSACRQGPLRLDICFDSASEIAENSGLFVGGLKIVALQGSAVGDILLDHHIAKCPLSCYPGVITKLVRTFNISRIHMYLRDPFIAFELFDLFDSTLTEIVHLTLTPMDKTNAHRTRFDLTKLVEIFPNLLEFESTDSLFHNLIPGFTNMRNIFCASRVANLTEYRLAMAAAQFFIRHAESVVNQTEENTPVVYCSIRNMDPHSEAEIILRYPYQEQYGAILTYRADDGEMLSCHSTNNLDVYLGLNDMNNNSEKHNCPDQAELV